MKLKTLPAWLAIVLILAGPRTATALSDDVFADIAREAYIYVLPSVMMYTTRAKALNARDVDGTLPINRFRHRRQLADHESRRVTTPNADTLYSSAWLDLSGGPLLLDVPDTGGRYYVLQFLDFFTNSFAHIGRRTTGTQAGRFLIAGPNAGGDEPAGVPVIRAPTNGVWLIGRILVDGPDDLAAVHLLQDGLRLTPLEGNRPVAPPTPPPRRGDGLDVVRIANLALTENPPPDSERDLLARFARIGIGPGLRFDEEGLSEERRAIVRRLGLDFRTEMRRQRERPRAGWSIPSPYLGDYGKRYRLRAITALAGLGANVPAEAMYFRLTADADGVPLNGSRSYALRFAPDQIPAVDAFWSISMYRVEPDLRSFFVANPIGRYAIGDRTPGLRYEPDGSLVIHVRRDRPEEPWAANWLPAPAGDFRLVLRAYQPADDLRQGRQDFPLPQRTD